MSGLTLHVSNLAGMCAIHRLLAYTSDVGESFRPILPNWVVNAGYAVSIGYVFTDVAYSAKLEHERGSSQELVARQAVETTVFQFIASLAIPTMLIHTAVHQTQNAVKRMPKLPSMVMVWGPSCVGLALVPILPIVDEPVEKATEMLFDAVWPTPKGWVRRHYEQHQHQQSGGKEGAAEAVSTTKVKKD